MKTLVLAAIIVLSTLTCAAAPCESCFELGGEALLWKAAASPLRYGQLIPEPPPPIVNDRRVLTVAADYDWGVRIWGRYADPRCCYFAQADWTYFRSTNRTSVIPPAGTTLAVGVAGNAFGAKARIKTEYDKVNVRLGACHQLSRCLGLNFYTGGRYVDLKREIFQLATSSEGLTVTFTRERGEFEGGGLEFGLGADYQWRCGFSFEGNFGGVVVIGEQRIQFLFQPLVSGSQFLRDRLQPRTICRPGTELRIALNYTYCCDCWTIKGTVGYEFDYYFSVFTPVTTSLNDDAFGIGWGGPVFGLAVGF